MTVSYTSDVANASNFGCFTNILLRWKGSVYKLIFKELFIYIILYFAINIFYRVVLVQEGLEEYRQMFEAAKAYCSIQMSSIPMTFGLGFYVSLIVKRWWDQYILLPWPDSLALYVVGIVQGLDERSRLMRRHILRYALLAYVITLRRISFRVRKRFPTMQHVVDAGLLRSDELKTIEALDEKCSVSKWWMPLVWATNIVNKAREETRIRSDPGMQTLLKELSSFRMGLTGVQHYDTISVPLVYTQVVTLAVYSYFGAALMASQWVEPVSPTDYQITYRLPPFIKVFNGSSRGEGSGSGSGSGTTEYNALDLYYPFFLTLQFIFYVGWLKVAEILINPFGEDDDDFELNYIIDRHIQVSYMIVDEMHYEHPELLKDMYWNETVPAELPYTSETDHYRKVEPKGGAEKVFEEELYSSSFSAYKDKLFSRKDSKKPNSFTSRNRSRNHRVEETVSSDYESVDTSIIGWWKAKLRKSQMRRSHSLSSPPTPTSLMSPKTQKIFQNQNQNGIHSQIQNNQILNQNQSLIESTKSQRSIYARILNSGTNGVLESENSNGVNNDNTNHKSNKNKKKTKKKSENDTDFERLRSPSNLTTISENQNSPYSTQPGSRRNSKYMVHENEEEINDSLAYYPLSRRGDDDYPRMRINSEGCENYEEVSVKSKDSHCSSNRSSSSSRSLPQSPLLLSKSSLFSSSSSSSSSAHLVISSSFSNLPSLPRRQARVAFDALSNDDVISVIYDESPSNECSSDTRVLLPDSFSSNNIGSAFENGAFYV